ncbi:hypothetical protein BD410DRAFT_844539 [Rickenella mellea]|uniref:Uncharacterized protein n=1 Tax=Rickenella mellea TaxID=50990 RepID=A0A4Y7PMA8_9AGAM|nr:hypothetical protein BD410DRAFT_844539 [Rickenella mellea]
MPTSATRHSIEEKGTRPRQRPHPPLDREGATAQAVHPLPSPHTRSRGTSTPAGQLAARSRPPACTHPTARSNSAQTAQAPSHERTHPTRTATTRRRPRHARHDGTPPRTMDHSRGGFEDSMESTRSLGGPVGDCKVQRRSQRGAAVSSQSVEMEDDAFKAAEEAEIEDDPDADEEDDAFKAAEEAEIEDDPDADEEDDAFKAAEEAEMEDDPDADENEDDEDEFSWNITGQGPPDEESRRVTELEEDLVTNALRKENDNAAELEDECHAAELEETLDANKLAFSARSIEKLRAAEEEDERRAAEFENELAAHELAFSVRTNPQDISDADGGVSLNREDSVMDDNGAGIIRAPLSAPFVACDDTAAVTGLNPSKSPAVAQTPPASESTLDPTPSESVPTILSVPSFVLPSTLAPSASCVSPTPPPLPDSPGGNVQIVPDEVAPPLVRQLPPLEDAITAPACHPLPDGEVAITSNSIRKSQRPVRPSWRAARAFDAAPRALNTRASTSSSASAAPAKNTQLGRGKRTREDIAVQRGRKRFASTTVLNLMGLTGTVLMGLAVMRPFSSSFS